MWAGVPSEPLCLHTQSLATAHFFMQTLPPIILLAGFPLIIVNLANSEPQLGHLRSPFVKSSAILSIQHFTKDPVPPFRYLYNCVLHFWQKILTVLVGPLGSGQAIATSPCYLQNLHIQICFLLRTGLDVLKAQYMIRLII
eukprot:TRINITY_DN11690_c0_g1_i3.p2 TRINITY_DN11690_c0_g1~~TRINITY_DN11690_c0_g1_i3.p2  ORF type:complete len:141 (-),score=7.00 TRINITY_DN11690_c0_g1_i3:124-546(-)